MSVSKHIIEIITKGAGKSDQQVKGLSKSLKGLAKSATLAAGAYLGTGALVSGIRQSLDAYAQQEQAERLLQGALGRSTGALLKQASALQKVSRFGDEAIIQQQAFLASLEFTEDQIRKIIPVALDLASATGMSLESAVRNTSKTFSGLAGELGELVPQLRGLTAEEMKAGKAVDVLGKIFAGSAQTSANTYAGTIDGMKMAIGDTSEAMGRLLAPTIIKSASMFKGAAEAVGAYLDSLRDLTDEEIRSTADQDRLVTEIDKVERALKEEERAVAMSGASMEFMGSQVHGTQEEVDRLTEKLALLNAQYSSLSIVMNTPAPVMTEDIKTATEQIELATIRQKEQDNVFTKVKTKTIDFAKAEKEFADMKAKQTKDQLALDLKTAALSGQSASDTMKSVVRAEVMEATAGAISSIMTGVPFPANFALAAGAGLAVGTMTDKVLNAIPSFATGGDFVTNGEQLIRVGDNPSGKERVQITPLDAGGTSSTGAVNITFQGNVLSDEYIETTAIPQIRDAIRRGADIGITDHIHMGGHGISTL